MNAAPYSCDQIQALREGHSFAADVDERACWLATLDARDAVLREACRLLLNECKRFTGPSCANVPITGDLDSELDTLSWKRSTICTTFDGPNRRYVKEDDVRGIVARAVEAERARQRSPVHGGCVHPRAAWTSQTIETYGAESASCAWCSEVANAESASCAWCSEVANAVAAERERCAKVAEEREAKRAYGSGDLGTEHNRTCHLIARAIRGSK